MLFGLRNSLWPTGDSLVPKRVRTTWLASRHSHASLIHVSELFTTRSSGRPIRFPRIVTPTGREKTVHAFRCPCTSRKCRFSRQMKVISVVSDIWSQSFYSTEASFQFNSKIYRRHVTEAWVRENSEVNPKLISGLMKQKSCPCIGIPDPSRTKHAARHRCWMKIGVCVICHMELRFGLHRTGSRKFYST